MTPNATLQKLLEGAGTVFTVGEAIEKAYQLGFICGSLDAINKTLKDWPKTEKAA